MLSRRLLLLLPLPFASRGAAGETTTIRGKLVQSGDPAPALEVEGGKRIALDGDADTLKVLRDARLAGADLEAKGRMTAPGRFAVDPIHTKAMFLHKDGKRLIVTYWCEVCAIRTYAPGICWCCQEETALDPREPEN